MPLNRPRARGGAGARHRGAFRKGGACRDGGRGCVRMRGPGGGREEAVPAVSSQPPGRHRPPCGRASRPQAAAAALVPGPGSLEGQPGPVRSGWAGSRGNPLRTAVTALSRALGTVLTEQSVF